MLRIFTKFSLAPSYRFYFVSISLLLCYLVFTKFYNTYAILNADEFWFSHAAYRYLKAIPYRDFPPYKTVLGYYLLALPLSHSHHFLKNLIFIKNIMGFINAGVLLLGSYFLQKKFHWQAVLLSLGLLIFSEIFLNYATNIRFDLLAYWCCFLALLLILNRQFILSGTLLGLGFLISQKTFWYIASINIGLMLNYFLFRSPCKSRRNFLHFNVAIATIINSYLIFWSIISDWRTVVKSVFLEAAMMYQLTWYAKAKALFWSYTLSFNPLLFLLVPITWISLFVTYDRDKYYAERFFIIVVTTILLIWLTLYDQVFPYYMQVMYPLFFILYAAFFSWSLPLFEKTPALKLISLADEKIFTTIILMIDVILFFLINRYHLPLYSYLLLPVPILLYISVTACKYQDVIRPLFFSIIGLVAIYSFLLFCERMMFLNGSYQKANLQIAQALLQKEDNYIAGVDYFYHQPQNVPGLKHLMGPAIEYLYHPSKQLRRVMLPSLDEDPNVSIDVVQEILRRTPVKYYINNYRMMALPPRLRNFLTTYYDHYWGSIYIYAPRVKAGKNYINLKFSGYYQIITEKNSHVKIDDKIFEAGVYYFTQGNYCSDANHSYRLKYVPLMKLPLSKHFFHDDWQYMI